jgi:hypothetical protein
MSSTIVSVRFGPGQLRAVGQLALAIFHGRDATSPADELVRAA